MKNLFSLFTGTAPRVAAFNRNGAGKTLFSPLTRRLFVLALFLLLGSQVFGQSDDSLGLNGAMQTVLDVIGSPWVKGIAVCALVIECIGLIMAGRQEQQMIKRFIPWIAGTVIFMAASGITSKFLNTDTLKTNLNTVITTTK
jgi:type IV secretory pathway VirB2 component (pilin)